MIEIRETEKKKPKRRTTAMVLSRVEPSAAAPPVLEAQAETDDEFFANLQEEKASVRELKEDTAEFKSYFTFIDCKAEVRAPRELQATREDPFKLNAKAKVFKPQFEVPLVSAMPSPRK